MAKKTTKKTSSTEPSKTAKFKNSLNEIIASSNEVLNDPTTKVSLGVAVLFIGAFFLISQISFISNWESDFDLNSPTSVTIQNAGEIGNTFGKLGMLVGWSTILKGFGVATAFFSLWLILAGSRSAFSFKRIKPWPLFNHSIILTLWFSITIAWFGQYHPTIWSGLAGYYIYKVSAIYLGHMGVLLALLGVGALYAIVVLKIKSLELPKKSSILGNNTSSTEHEILDSIEVDIEQEPSSENRNVTFEFGTNEEVETESDDWEIIHKMGPNAPQVAHDLNTSDEDSFEAEKLEIESIDEALDSKVASQDSTLSVQVEVLEEKVEDDSTINKKVKDFGEYDPTLDLSKFQLPKIDLLEDYGNNQITFDKAEIEANKDRIVDTLKNYNIEIKEIKATIGPTVTLYEIVPAAGIRISKIKNLEDDIALSLAALGIRIIAPIPGKGTIGIEVPNAKPQMVSMRQVIASQKFQEADMELPVAMGRTITNENFIFDLAKMPHLLMAGATGQGKSVGLNAILTSLLYKKHPSQLKFVLVDPKKVELTLYNKIERHYLAVLPDSDEAIITDTTKVINTLNSLCIEMDNRYELLKSAMVRNIKEYNAKFVNRRLNPEEGHKYLPYIVLVIDEFADLIMTAGKEVEMPIARLAQLARAIGIHLIVATQRPSVNVITGIIKANFPARAAFRVTSKIDSRTILDAGGADQLIGKGDMLFSQGSSLTRLQCAFVDTPEVDEICDFIGNQKAYPTAYQLPEYVGEEGGGSIGDLDPSDRDSMFEDAARLVVATQQGSTSMIQRKLKLGYNRAGRIVDQLEAAGILGPFEGSKARQVLVPDEFALEQKLNGDA